MWVFSTAEAAILRLLLNPCSALCQPMGESKGILFIMSNTYMWPTSATSNFFTLPEVVTFLYQFGLCMQPSAIVISAFLKHQKLSYGS
jgi:hypothetical protein